MSEINPSPTPPPAPAPAPDAAAPSTITLDDFKKIQLVVAQIKTAAEHPNADRLYVLTVDTVGGERQIVAGIRKAYTPDQLIGRKVVMVANLQPSVIRGVTSNGMLLAASDDVGMALLTPEKDVKVGSAVK